MCRRYFILTTILIVCSWRLTAQDFSPISIDSLLCTIYDRDQSVRESLQKALVSANADSIIYYNSRMKLIDIENKKQFFRFWTGISGGKVYLKRHTMPYF